ncbi:MAG: Zn-dependent M28 family amino/carboxypeptidase [Cryomorphaceae bacterium]|jgi:Zn-dependent M28 family amino/carboxypeptidase
MKRFLSTLALILMAANLTACDSNQQTEPQGQAAVAQKTASLNNDAAITTAAAQVDEAGFMQHIKVLASDEYEGRAPSTPGGQKTVAYLETEFKKLGLKPAFGSGETASFRQPVELMQILVENAPSLTFSYADGELDVLPYKESSVVSTSRISESSALENSELVFVGYGVVAPEYGWNDYAGVDMTGKTAVILVNDPGFRNPDGELFKGRTMTYYGRWTYKYEEAARQGAAGAIIVHEDTAAGYPWEVVSGGWSGPQYNLFAQDGNKDNLAIESWVTQQAAESLFAKSGQDYQHMVAAAGQASFSAVPLAAKASTSLQLSSQNSTSYNVGAVIEGRERPDELFIYTAHWDHLGIKEGAEGADLIYNGAQDNATGTSGILEMAQAFMNLPEAPERSVMFLAVTAEESGLLGSKWYAGAPAFPMAKTVAGINVDGMSTAGETDDIVVVGFGNSEMDDYLRTVSAVQNRTLVPEHTPEKGYFYRSDHFNLAKKGVPMLYAEAGSKVRSKPEGYGGAQASRYVEERYHKPADEVHAEWDNGGIMQDLNAHFRIGVAIADSNDWPKWSAGNEFKSIREASQQAPAE